MGLYHLRLLGCHHLHDSQTGYSRLPPFFLTTATTSYETCCRDELCESLRIVAFLHCILGFCPFFSSSFWFALP